MDWLRRGHPERGTDAWSLACSKGPRLACCLCISRFSEHMHAEHNKWSKHRMTDWFDGLPLVTEQGTHYASASYLAVRRTNISVPLRRRVCICIKHLRVRPSMFVPCCVSTCVSPLVPALWVLARRDRGGVFAGSDWIGARQKWRFLQRSRSTSRYTGAVHCTARRIMCT
jgi:hypothetical protein